MTFGKADPLGLTLNAKSKQDAIDRAEANRAAIERCKAQNLTGRQTAGVLAIPYGTFRAMLKRLKIDFAMTAEKDEQAQRRPAPRRVRRPPEVNVAPVNWLKRGPICCWQGCRSAPAAVGKPFCDYHAREYRGGSAVAS